MAHRNRRGARKNSIGLDGNQLRTLWDHLDGSGRGASRQFMRWPFRREAVGVHIIQADGSRTAIDMVTRNISAGGIALLHSSYLHVGTRVIVEVPGIAIGLASLRGVVRACHHVSGRVHEIGIEFEQRIDLANFLPCDLIDGCHTLDFVEPAELQGRALVIDDRELDRRIVRHLLRNTRLEVDEAASPALWEGDGREAPDVVLCEQSLATPVAITALRQRLGARPIIAIGDSLKSAREAVRGLDVDGYVPKPLDERSLLRMLGEFLLLRTPATESAGVGVPAESQRLVAEEFAVLAGSLAECIAKDDARGAMAIAQRVWSLAEFAGRADLGEHASGAAEALAGQRSCRAAAVPLRALALGLGSSKAA